MSHKGSCESLSDRGTRFGDRGVPRADRRRRPGARLPQTFEQVAAASRRSRSPSEQVQELHGYLDEHGIEVVEPQESDGESPSPRRSETGSVEARADGTPTIRRIASEQDDDVAPDTAAALGRSRST